MKTKLDLTRFQACEEGLDFYEQFYTFYQAWNACPNGEWMLWAANRLEIDIHLYIHASALCANTVRHLMKDPRSTAAIDAAIRFGKGEIMRFELDKYIRNSHDVVLKLVGNGIYYLAAFAAYSATNTSYNAAYSACIANMRDMSKLPEVAKKESNLRTAEICRDILTEAVFAKVKQLENEQSKNNPNA
jgi:hypothetical protein